MCDRMVVGLGKMNKVVVSLNLYFFDHAFPLIMNLVKVGLLMNGALLAEVEVEFPLMNLVKVGLAELLFHVTLSEH